MDSSSNNRQRNVIIAVVVAVVVLLCCCCVAVALSGYFIWGDALMNVIRPSSMLFGGGGLL